MVLWILYIITIQQKKYDGWTQNKYIIGCDPCHEDGDHFIVWIKDKIMELFNGKDRGVGEDLSTQSKTL